MQNISYIEETDKFKTHNLYKICFENDEICVKQIKKSAKQWQSLTSFFMTAFLPHGYPNSVSRDYLRYQIWDSIQAFASSITGSVCTHAVLKGAGVGDETASPLAATITWLIKDGTSMVGRITFAWLQGTKLDCDCKKWRLFADVMNDIAMLLDLISASFHSHFTLIMCLSGLMKAIVGVAGGSTRSALTQHQARNNNIADVSAKDGSQETLVNLLALIFSLVIIPVVTKSFILTWVLYILMTIIHLTANYFAVRSVVMETFNSSRFKIFTSHYISQNSSSQNLLSVDEVNRKERVFFSFQPKKTIIKLGSSFKDIIDGKSPKEVESILQLCKECDYMLTCTLKKNDNVVIKVALNSKATVLTEIEAMYQCCYLDHMLKNNRTKNIDENNLIHNMNISRKYTKKTFCDFLNNVKGKGFNVNAVYFNTDKWRVNW